MKKINPLKVSIFSLFIALFLALPTMSNIQQHTVPLPIPDKTFIVQAQEDDEFEEFTDHPVLANNSNIHPQWNHNVMNIGQAWADGYTGEGISIAILDTGFFHNHPDLSMAGGNSVFPDDPWSNDHSGHGTHIAGIIGADVGTTYQGIAPDADLYGIKIYHSSDMNEEGYVSTNTSSVSGGIRHAIDLDVDIIVISSGLTYHDEELYQEIQNAYAQDIMIIAASGNGNTTVNYPANYSEVIAVTAVDERLQPALDIIYGQENDFAAPGVNIGGLSIPSSTYSYPYIFMSGSSQAAPHAAGLAAILMQKYNVRGEEALQIMRQHAESIGDPGFFGNGLLRYVSDEEIADTESGEEPEEEPEEPENSTVETTENGVLEESEEELAVRKPTSSRAADDEDEISLAYHQTEAIDQGDAGSVATDTLPLVENGGTLEIWLNDLSPLFLNENQVANIRERNITIVLARENVTWMIPPANFLPGEAVLRFYEGMPTGVVRQTGAETPIYTTSIYQTDARRASYPGWMEIRFDLSQSDRENLSTLDAYYWNKEEDQWAPSQQSVNGESIILRTRHTSALGFFDPERITVEDEPEEEIVEEEEKEEEESTEISTKSIVSVIGVLILLGVIAIYFRRKSKRK